MHYELIILSFCNMDPILDETFRSKMLFTVCFITFDTFNQPLRRITESDPEMPRRVETRDHEEYCRGSERKEGTRGDSGHQDSKMMDGLKTEEMILFVW